MVFLVMMLRELTFLVMVFLGMVFLVMMFLVMVFFGDGVFGDGVSKEGERLELSWARVRHEESLISEKREDLPFTMLPFSPLVKSDKIFDWFQNNWIS